jgi:hypothetical protein
VDAAALARCPAHHTHRVAQLARSPVHTPSAPHARTPRTQSAAVLLAALLLGRGESASASLFGGPSLRHTLLKASLFLPAAFGALLAVSGASGL